MTPLTNPVSAFKLKEGTLREGIPIEKGVVLTEDFMEKNEDLIKQYCNFFMLYPDLFLETVQTKDCPIHLYYY